MFVVGCRSLLDSRLSATNANKLGGEFASSASQLVKAVNKLMIQVAVASHLNASLQGLMNLQYNFSYVEEDLKIAKVSERSAGGVEEGEHNEPASEAKRSEASESQLVYRRE